MQYTNRFNLPIEIVNLLTANRYNETNEDLGDYSATRLIAPIQQTTLIKRYPDDLKVFDVIDNYWSMIGSTMHKLLEEAASSNSIVEKRFYTDILGKRISGQTDHYHSGIISDYKGTKAWKIMKGDFSEWENQLNVLAYLARANGLPVERLRIFAFILDWKQQDTYQKEYPECPILEIPLPLWPHGVIEAWIEGRIAQLIEAESCHDKALAMGYRCTDKDMWRDLKDIAIYNANDKERKRAKKVFKSEEDFLTCELKYDEIAVRRYTERTRCLKHCPVSNHCVQHYNLCLEEGRPPENTEFIF